MELVDKLMQHALDDETFKMYNEGLRDKQQGLEKEAAELEQKLSQEREDKEAIHAFQLEVQRFARLDISDEDILRNILQKLIAEVRVFEGGKIEIVYNFKRPMSAGA